MIADSETSPPADDRRDPDAQAALESAFVAGTLPEADRREPADDQIAKLDAARTEARIEFQDMLAAAARENAALRGQLADALAPHAPEEAPPSLPVEAERRFNEFTGRVERFTASGDQIQ